MPHGELLQRAAALVERAGLRGSPEIELLPGSANNRGFRLRVDGCDLFLKEYFQHPSDPRDRLGTEFSFLRFAWTHGLRTLPEPLAADPERGLALYEFVRGRRLEPPEVTEAALQQALDFYRQLNRHRRSEDAVRLPAASEACFSVAEHLACVENRVKRLQHPETLTLVDRDASAFVINELARVWGVIKTRLESACHERCLQPDEPIEVADRRLSPSDFGYHNALLTEGGVLRFLDFEYAGWDDAAKLVCDFFCQPQVPVSADFYDWFASEVAADLSNPEQHRCRMDLLLPVYRVKWCCIMLNVFLPGGRLRRRFAKGEADVAAHKWEQLGKARRTLAMAVPSL